MSGQVLSASLPVCSDLGSQSNRIECQVDNCGAFWILCTITPICLSKVLINGVLSTSSLKKGAGLAAGFTDQMYLDAGGVEIVQTKAEVISRGDVVLKVSQPVPDELDSLKASQILIAIWGICGCIFSSRMFWNFGGVFAAVKTPPEAMTICKTSMIEKT